MSSLKIKTIKTTIDDYLPPELTNIIITYTSEMIVLHFTGHSKEEDCYHYLVCYKAMERQKWEALVNGIVDRYNKGINYNIYGTDDDNCLSEKDIIEATTVIVDEKLITAMEYIYPHHLGNDIDFFDAIENGDRKVGNEWETDKQQPHNSIYKLAKLRRKRENRAKRKQAIGQNNNVYKKIKIT